MLYLSNVEVHSPGQPPLPGAGVVADELIRAVGPNESCPPGAEVLEGGGLLAVPGFIDLQLNGAFGLDFTADPAAIWDVAARLPQHGVTAFLPTIITSPMATIHMAQTILLAGSPANFHGAIPLGLHLEGPFLNPGKRGAHNPAHLRPPDPGAVTDWSRERGVRLVTLAPELPGALELVACLRDRGVVASAGHSLATYAEALAGFEAGITYGTHIFNAMPNLDHRAPGLAGALLIDSRPTLGLIPDGVHLHPAVVKLIWQAVGPERLNVVTDAMAALGRPPGRYRLGDFDVSVDSQSARLGDGRLAGSILSMDCALRNIMHFTGCSLDEALAPLTSVPARVMADTHRGRIASGCVADLVLLDRDLQVVSTIVGGRVVYRRAAAQA